MRKKLATLLAINYFCKKLHLRRLIGFQFFSFLIFDKYFLSEKRLPYLRLQARKLLNPNTGRKWQEITAQGLNSYCYWNEHNLNLLTTINWRESLVPQAAVIPASIAYIKVAAVKKLVAEFGRGHFVRHKVSYWLVYCVCPLLSVYRIYVYFSMK